MTTVNDIQTKINGSWTSLNIPKVHNGTGEPSSLLGKDGDIYIQYTTTAGTNTMVAMWSKVSGEWLTTSTTKNILYAYTFSDLKNLLTTSHDTTTVIKLGADIISTETITMNNVYNTLDLNGHNITSDGTAHRFVQLTGSTQFFLNGNGVISRFYVPYNSSDDKAVALISLDASASFTMLNGIISNNTMSMNTYTYCYGIGVIVAYTMSSSARSGRIYIYGGEISNNTCSCTMADDKDIRGTFATIASNTPSGTTDIYLYGGIITSNMFTVTASSSYYGYAGGVSNKKSNAIVISGNVNITGNYYNSVLRNIAPDSSIHLVDYISGEIRTNRNNTLGSTFGTCTEGALYAYNIKNEDGTLQGSVSGTNLVWVGVTP